MSMSEWPQSYKDARQAFLAASSTCGANVNSKKHSEKGPNLEDLCLDVPRIGKAESRKALVIMSGTHGVFGKLHVKALLDPDNDKVLGRRQTSCGAISKQQAGPIAG